MKGWCKIIRLEGHDVLVRRMVDRNKHYVEMTLRLKEGSYNTVLTYKTERESIKAYKDITKPYAEKFRDAVLDPLKKFVEENGNAEKSIEDDKN